MFGRWEVTRPINKQTTLCERSIAQIFSDPSETLINGLDHEETELSIPKQDEDAGQCSPGVAVKGFFPTPEKTVDQMVESLFAGRIPCAESTVLDPGCGEGAFIGGIIRWCERNDVPNPRISGVDSDPRRVEAAKKRYGHCPGVRIALRDFLMEENERYDYIIGNPPYVPITQLSESEKAAYRGKYRTAIQRFDLYLLFFEEALNNLNKGGRLVFITPEKFIYVDTAAPLRKILTKMNVEELRMVSEETFGDLVAYPTISTVTKSENEHHTRVVHRDGSERTVDLPSDGGSWLPVMNGHFHHVSAAVLADVCVRISCGVATGADSIYVLETSHLPDELTGFAHPTVAGRQIDSRKGTMTLQDCMLVPYERSGKLMKETELGALKAYLKEPERQNRLKARTCVKRRAWYAFHENPPMTELLQPKILCKDIGEVPTFVIDRKGDLIPRHTVYYIIPKDPSKMEELTSYLNGPVAREWLTANCQRAANGFLRVQSQVLKKLPVPAELAPKSEGNGGFF